MKRSARDSVIYYWSTIRFSDGFVCVVLMHFSLGALFQAKSMKKLIKIPPTSSMSKKYQKKNYKSMQGH